MQKIYLKKIKAKQCEFAEAQIKRQNQSGWSRISRCGLWPPQAVIETLPPWQCCGTIYSLHRLKTLQLFCTIQTAQNTFRHPTGSAKQGWIPLVTFAPTESKRCTQSVFLVFSTLPWNFRTYLNTRNTGQLETTIFIWDLGNFERDFRDIPWILRRANFAHSPSDNDYGTVQFDISSSRMRKPTQRRKPYKYFIKLIRFTLIRFVIFLW